jgi:serine/threonine protein kinase
MSEESGIRVLAGRYRLVSRVGHRVMRGWDLHLRRVVAVRVFPPPDGSDQVVERASKLADLAHPGLVRVLDAGNADGEPFLVAEFIAGTTLKARLADGPLPAETVGPMGVMLAKALAYAHSRDVTHRDISPGNVLLGPGNEPYLAHLGIEETPSPSYMAPEQVEGAPPSHAADIYALGLVLLESLTGRVQYPGSDIAAMRARLTHPPSISPDVPLAEALVAMTATDPAERPDATTCIDLLRGDSAKARVQTRIVLIAALAAAVVATTVTLIVNSSGPEPPRQPQEPLRQVAVAPRHTAPNSPLIEEPAVTTTTTTAVPPPAQKVAVTSDVPPPPADDTSGASESVTPVVYPAVEDPLWYIKAFLHEAKKKLPPGQAKKNSPVTQTSTTPVPSGSQQNSPQQDDQEDH